MCKILCDVVLENLANFLGGGGLFISAVLFYLISYWYIKYTFILCSFALSVGGRNGFDTV